MELSLEQVKGVLASLGFECQPTSDSELEVTSPYWRTDITLAADLVEEVARIIGYDQIPATLLGSPLPHQQPDPFLALRERLGDLLVECGFQEVISYSLTSERLSRTRPYPQPPLRVANPMTKEQEYLRTSLRPNLLNLLSSNQRHESEGIRLFEMGKIYLPREGDLPEEREMLVGVLSGPRAKQSWFGGGGKLDFFDAKGAVETLLQRLGIEAEFESTKEENLHPGRAAMVIIEGEVVGTVGELHPKVAESLELLPSPVSLFEIKVGKLLSYAAEKKYRPLPRFPSSVRDIALVVDARVPAKKIRNIIQSFPLVSQATIFDLYTGGKVPVGKKSLAFRVVYQSPTHTLTDEEVERVERDILAKLSQEVGATLRS